MTFTRGAECAAVSDDFVGASGTTSRVPHDEQDGHLPVLVVVMYPHCEHMYLVIFMFAII